MTTCTNIVDASSLGLLRLQTASWVTPNCRSRRVIVVVCPELTSTSSVTGALVMEMAYGMDIKSHKDKFLQAAEMATEHFEHAVTPGAFFVDTFPIRSFQSFPIPVTPG